MLNFGRLFGLLGAPTMDMGGQTMVGTHGGFSMHGPMLMAGKVDPNTNFSYATSRQLIAPTEHEVEHGAVERLPVVRSEERRVGKEGGHGWKTCDKSDKTVT